MASLLKEIGNVSHGTEGSWASDADANENVQKLQEEKKMEQNEEKVKSLFGSYNIIKAQTSIDRNAKAQAKELSRFRVQED